MKFGFVTCVQLGLSCIEEIYKIGGKLDLVISLEDNQAINKSGRVFLDDFCHDHQIVLHKSTHINNKDCVNIIKQYQLDWLFIIGWSQIVNASILNAPTKGALGIHPTLLPQGRGRAAIPWAILKGLKETGVTLFKLDEGVDTGDIVDQTVIPLAEYVDATQLYQCVNEAHVKLIRNTYFMLEDDQVKFIPQDNSEATIWLGRSPEDGLIDVSGSVVTAERLIRAATHPYPGAYFILNEDKIIIWKAKIVRKRTSNMCIVFSDGILECLDWNRV